ncbi:O-antigen ligase family protein [Mycolicibacterium gilvum]|nr:O-antigen ligase family protein [Mycolicibacterium gilvum]
MAGLALFAAFASLPAGIPVGKILGPTIVYVHEVLVLLAIACLILIVRPRFSTFALPLVFVLTISVATTIGLVSGRDLNRVVGEAKLLLVMTAGYVLAFLIVRAGLVMQAVRVMAIVLWFSATMILLSSLTGIILAGRNESLTAATGTGAVRILTATQTPALAILTALIAYSIIGRVQRLTWLKLGAPALAIIFFGFSRNSLLALAVAAIAASLFSLNWRSVKRLLIMLFYGVVLAVVASVLLLGVQGASSSGWLIEQSTAFTNRVFGGVSGSALATDESAQYRLRETTYLIEAISEAPFLGHGFGYAYQPPIVAEPDSFEVIDGPFYAHNFYLWLFAKAGLLGMLGFLWLAVTPVIRAAQTPTIEAKVSAVVASSLLVICVVNPLPLGPSNSLALGLALGSALAAIRPRGVLSPTTSS